MEVLGGWAFSHGRGTPARMYDGRFEAIQHSKEAQHSGALSLEKPPDLDPFFDELTRAKSAKELK